MVPTRRCELLIAILGGCLPPDSPPPVKPTIDPDVAALVHDWKVTGHEVGTKTSMSDQDATGYHGRAITITETGYTTPWHGTCEQAKRARAANTLVEVTADVDVSPDGRTRLRQFGLAKDLTEYTLTCALRTVPPLTVWLTGDRAMTCFGGVCYLLTR